MRVIIAGSRHLWALDHEIQSLIDLLPAKPTLILSGGARGIDTAGERWARRRGVEVACCEANWGEHGVAAGPIRNQQMVDNADALVLIWDGKSRGSRDVLTRAQEKKLVIVEKFA